MQRRIPILNRSIDVFSLPLSTKEGFVLSRIDDVSTVEDISIMVGIKLNDLLAMLDRLAELGAVKLSWGAPRPASRPLGPGTSAANHKPVQPPRVAADGQPPPPPKGEAHPAVARVLATPVVPLYTESEVQEHGDLSEAHKRRTLNAYYGLAGKDYYQLLGLSPTADKKEIRAAYFELSRLFHPDSMFGKDLGSFKVKMETVFKRLTEAYEVLGRNQRRKEYDDYLATTVSTSVIQHTIDRVDSQVRALSTAPPASPVPEPPARASEPLRMTIAPKASEPPPRASQPQPARPPASTEERKAIARDRLLRNFVGGTPVTSQKPVPPAVSGRPSLAGAPAAQPASAPTPPRAAGPSTPPSAARASEAP
ncbi:MAG: J domain-containing protein, partial [Polyangiales bacterium]